MEKIRVCTRMNEYTKTRYYQDFIIENSLPTEEYFGEKIKSIERVEIDTEQGNDNIWNYNYYMITTQYYDAFDEDLVESYFYIAIEKEIDYE